MNRLALKKLMLRALQKKASLNKPVVLEQVRQTPEQKRFMARMIVSRMARPKAQPQAFSLNRTAYRQTPDSISGNHIQAVTEKEFKETSPQQSSVSRADLEEMMVLLELEISEKIRKQLKDLKQPDRPPSPQLPEISIMAKPGNVSRLRFLQAGVDIGQDIQTVDFISGFQVTRRAPGYLGLVGAGTSLDTGPDFVDNETPSGTMDGLNTDFTLAETPVADSLRLFLNGQFLTEGVDYTLVGTTVALATAPGSGEILRAFYRSDDGDMTFADNEIPAGAIDGVNASFTLAEIPIVDASVNLYLNGMELTEGVDYAISGQALTMANIPQVGDPFRAYYRTSVASANFADNETPAGTVDGSNTDFTLSHNPNPSSGSSSNEEHIDNETPAGTLDGANATFTLAGQPIAGSLKLFRNGQFLTLNEDYALSGVTIVLVNAPESDEVIRAFYRIVGTAGTSSLMLYLNGQLVTQGVDFNLSGNTVSFFTAPDAGFLGLPFKAFYRY